MDEDPLRTAVEIDACGATTLEALQAFAESEAPAPVDLHLLSDVHRRWHWRRENAMPEEETELVRFLVTEANTVTIAVYDIHPFVDGNTRTTWHFRNYLLMLDGLRPLVALDDQEAYEAAWWSATPNAHDELDAIVLRELHAQDR